MAATCLRGCCKIRTFAFIIGLTFLLVQTAYLILSFFMIKDIEGHTQNILDWLADRGLNVPSGSTESGLNLTSSATGRLTGREYIIRKSGDYLAIPITINVVLIISDVLLIWSSAAQNRILLWPWILLHFLEFIFFICALIFAMVILPEPWFKVVVFLIGCPIIVLLGFFLFVVKCFYNVLRDSSIKKAMAAVYQNKPIGHNHELTAPATMYKPNPHHWDQPAPVWSLAHPTTSTSTTGGAWEPESLQKYEAHYTKNGRKPRHRRTDRTFALPDGTMIVPIHDDDDDGEPYPGQPIGGTTSKSDTAVANFDEEDSFENGPESTTSQRSGRSLSTKFGLQHVGARNSDNLAATVMSTTYDPPLSEDRSSIISLSDKYRQQDEMEIFHDQFLSPPPPEPIRPNRHRLPVRPTGSTSTNESFRENFKL